MSGTGKANAKATAKRIQELTTAICQHGLTVPEGYAFDPRRRPSLFKLDPPVVANVLRSGVNEKTHPDCGYCAGRCTGACAGRPADPAGEELEGSAP